MKSAWILMLAIPHLLLCSSLTINEAKLSYTTLNDPNSSLDGFGSMNNGINSSGEIVGCYTKCTYGFLYDDGVFKSLYADAVTMPSGINSSGQIVGTSSPCAEEGCPGVASGFLYNRGKFTTISVPGADAYAEGINDRGQIVGYPSVGGGSGSFLYSGGVFTTIAFPGAASTLAYGINDQDQIVGVITDKTGEHHDGFLYSGGVFTKIDVPGAEDTWAYGINNRGQIVGAFIEPGGEFGFLDTGGNFTAILPPGTLNNLSSYFDAVASGINDSGQIVGSFYAADGYNGYVATPVPEPSSAALAGSLIGFFAIVFRRRLMKRP